MAPKQSLLVHGDKEDYINMELGSCSKKEFEFQKERHSTTSSADELFHDGILLPLHLPSRNHMLQNATFDRVRSLSSLEHSPTILINFPFKSSKNSQSRRTSYSECSSEIAGLIDDLPNKSSPKNQKLTKKLSLKIKAYLKSLFTKSVRSDKNAAEKVEQGKKPTCKGERKSMDNVGENKHKSFMKRRTNMNVNINNSSRRSFPGLLKRSVSAHYDMEISVEGAIEYCKQSQMKFTSNKTPQDGDKVGSEYAPKLEAGGNQEMEQLGITHEE